MATGAESSFDVNIRTRADRTGVQETEQDLDRLKAKAAATPVAPGPGLTGEAGAKNDREIAALERKIALNHQILSGEIEASTVDAERLANEERRAGVMAQRQILVDLETEQLQAQAAGETNRVAVLEEEINLRRIALQIQTSTGLSEDEALTIARARVVAEAEITAAQEAQGAASIFAGAQIAKARNEVITLLRELVSGAGTARTLGALLGALGPALGISGVAAFVVEGAIKGMSTHLDETRKEAEKQTLEFQKEADAWREMAASASTFADLQKIHESVSKSVTAELEKARQLPSEGTEGFLTNQLDGLKLYANSLGHAIGIHHDFQTSTDEAVEKQLGLVNLLERTGKSSEDQARKHTEVIRDLIALPYAESIEKAQEHIDELTRSQEANDRSTEKLERRYRDTQSQITATARAIAEITETHKLLQKQEELEVQLAVTSDPAKRDGIQKELDDLRLKLAINERIRQAEFDAAAFNKALTADEKKAIEEEVKGPLTEKLSILREIEKLTGKSQQDRVDNLLGTKPKTESDRQYWEKIFQDPNARPGDKERARVNLVADDERRLSALNKPPEKPTGTLDQNLDALQKRSETAPLSKSLDDLGNKVDGAGKDGSAAVGRASDAVVKSVLDLSGITVNGFQSIAKEFGGAFQSHQRVLDQILADIANLWKNKADK